MAQGEVQLTSVDSKYCGAGEGKLEILSEIGEGHTRRKVQGWLHEGNGPPSDLMRQRWTKHRANSQRTLPNAAYVSKTRKIKLDHPHIIKYYTSFIESGDLNIVLELADSGDLARLIQHFRRCGRLIPEPTIWRYFSQVCAALKYMHLKRIMHRDVKPANVFITRDGMAKLGDLGMARFLNLKSTAANTLLGTPYYMSPERVQEQEYDLRSDVWSAGCLLYELAALQCPFSSDTKNLVSLFKKIVASDYPPLPSNLYSDELRALVSVCMDPNLMKRRDMSYACTVATQMYERFVRAAACKMQTPSLT
ncbi:serine/threonine-protein kinase Nek7-like isoform X2 [Amblyomma americanum]